MLPNSRRTWHRKVGDVISENELRWWWMDQPRHLRLCIRNGRWLINNASRCAKYSTEWWNSTIIWQLCIWQQSTFGWDSAAFFHWRYNSWGGLTASCSIRLTSCSSFKPFEVFLFANPLTWSKAWCLIPLWFPGPTDVHVQATCFKVVCWRCLVLEGPVKSGALGSMRSWWRGPVISWGPCLLSFPMQCRLK